ncbi:MAG: hypothetical protein IJO32_01400 [Bacilli bacterium]|nr:hypothetical protein [Bacilli bacterium]
MREMNKEYLLQIDGGVNISGAIVTAFTKAFNTILDIGRSLGTAIRRINSGQMC